MRLSLIRRAKRGEAAVTRNHGKRHLASGGVGGRVYNLSPQIYRELTRCE